MPLAPSGTCRVVMVYPTTPVSGSGIDPDKVPASVNLVDANQIKQTGSLNVSDALQKYVPGVLVNEVSGNPFQPNVEFRGFVASPVAGTPQGLAVYQNGVRVNEAFGDTVNWDLIPTAAIKSVTVVTNNPAFGLNALGGAVNVQMKDGFNYHGAEIDTMGGSFGRVQSSAQWGKQVDNFAVYGALEGLHDDGFRNFSASNVRRFYGDVGYRNDTSEFHVNMGAADNNFGATATAPVELLQQYWGATYTSPQTTENRVGYVNLTGKVEATPTWTLDGSAHVRVFDQRILDANPTGTQPCTADPTQLCFGDGSTPANGLNGAQLANPFDPGAVLGETDRTTTHSTTTGVSLQATNTDRLFGHNNHFAVGFSFDSSVTNFTASAELGTIGPGFVVGGSGIFLGQSGDPVSIGPVDLRTTSQYSGLYALDTFDVTNAFSITGGGRFNVANISLQDQIGTSLNGNDTYTRFNPIIGGTYKITSGLTAYAGYSEANRAPTPLELGCADPAHPCIIAAFLVSDPPLKQVVSRTVEAGLRGARDLDIGTLGWKLGVFRAENSDDILAIPSPVLQGFGYFQNVGSTRRQGHRGRGQSQVDRPAAICQLYAGGRAVPRRSPGRLQQPVRGRQRQRPDSSGQSNSGDPAKPRQGGHRLFGDRRVQGWRRCAVRQQPVPRRRRIQSGTAAAVLCRFQPARLVSDRQDVPDLRARRQYLRQPLCDLRHVLRYRRGAQFRQWRRAVHGPAFAQSGAAARLLYGPEGHLLSSEGSPLSPPAYCGEPKSRGRDRKPRSPQTETPGCSR